MPWSSIPQRVGVGERLLARTLAGDGLVGGVSGEVLDLDAERPGRVETRNRLPGLEIGLAGVGQVVDDDRGEEDGVRLAGGRVGRDLLAGEELEGNRDARAADGGGVGDGGALAAGVPA